LVQKVHRPVPMPCALTTDWLLMLVEVMVLSQMPLQQEAAQQEGAVCQHTVPYEACGWVEQLWHCKVHK
jgi:hypothetical protein